MKKSIVLIEDDKKVRNHITEVLEVSNFIVFSAENEKNGVVLIKTIVPDLIICAISSNKLIKLSIFQIVKQNPLLKQLPFLFLVNKKFLNNKTLKAFVELKTTFCLIKPFSNNQLLKAVKERLQVNFTQLKKSKKKFDSAFFTNSINNKKVIKDFLTSKITYTYTNGATIYCQGNLSNHIFYIKRGEVKTYKVDEQGKEFITGYYKKNETFGYSSFIIQESHFENSEAITKVELYKINKNEIIQLLETHPNLFYNILKFLALEIMHQKDKSLLMAYGSVRRKTAITLLKLANKLSYKGDMVAISRINLAHLIGIEYETLIRTLHDFKEEKLVVENEKGFKLIHKNKLLKTL
jgi:CRP-like cAMP-binding protein/ActR/RegA family two-component response regulator